MRDRGAVANAASLVSSSCAVAALFSRAAAPWIADLASLAGDADSMGASAGRILVAQRRSTPPLAAHH